MIDRRGAEDAGGKKSSTFFRPFLMRRELISSAKS